jgi:hypothetical protein
MSIWLSGWITVSGARCARRFFGWFAGHGMEKSFGLVPVIRKVSAAFLSRESILIWTLKTWRNNRVRYAADMANPQYQHIRFVRLTHPKQVDSLIASLT